MSELHPSVVAALSRVRRAEGEGGGRRAFTVARTEAVLRLRELPRPGAWHFTLALVRAANAVARGARGFARERDEGEARVVTLTFSTAGFDHAGVDLQGLVLAAAEGDSDMSDGTCLEMHASAARWRRLVGAGVNGALAGAPTSVEVRTSAGCVRYVRKDSHAAGQDPYGEQRAPGRCPPQAFEVEVRWPRPGFGRRLASWLSRQAGAEAAVTELWRAALPGAEPAQTAGQGVELGRSLPGMEVSLGTVGTWGAAPQLGGPWLVREGVKLVSLAPALTRLGVAPNEVAGWVDCPRLRLTADETSVALDAGFELLAAWLLDARAHSFPAAGEPGFVVKWPSELAHLPAVSGRPAPIDQVAQRCRQGRDLVYVWPHQARDVPPAIRARVFALWPSELAVVTATIPEARPVPARALGESPQFERVDLSNLRKSSLPSIQVDLGAEAAATTAAGVKFAVAVEAFVHRFPSAEEGSIALLCHERRVAHVREAARAIAGVTLIATLTGETPEALTIDGLRAEKELLSAIAERCRTAALRAIGPLLAQAMTHSEPWELPLVRAQARALAGAALAVRYRAVRDAAIGGEEAAELAWDESPLLGLAVGRDMAGQAVTLQQALVRCRDVGGIVVEDPRQRWTTFRSSDPRHEPWELSREGRALLERVAGDAVLWDMPTTPAGNLLPAPAAGQERLVLGAGAIEQVVSGPRTARARADLRAHVLVAEALGGAAPEVVDLPLFVRYDPRTLEPLRLVSRSDARAERLALLPPGSGTRALAGPALLVTPGEARLLHAAGHPLAAAAAPVTAATTTRATRMPVRRAGSAAPSLAVLPIADALCLGALRVEGGPAKIAVWGGGLHIKDLTLPPPLDWVGGRLALTREGARAGAERLAGQVRSLAREVARRALRERLLHAPGSPQRAGLDAFRARCAAEGPEIVREETGGEGHVLSDMLSTTLKKQPLRRLGPGPRRFEGLLRQALGRPIAVDGALLSWQAARLGGVDGRAWSIELGRRNAEIQRALADEATTDALFAAAALAVAQLFAEARARGAAGSGLPEELVAGYRLLALLYAHVP